jgi:hypothetical protein
MILERVNLAYLSRLRQDDGTEWFSALDIARIKKSEN